MAQVRGDVVPVAAKEFISALSTNGDDNAFLAHQAVEDELVIRAGSGLRVVHKAQHLRDAVLEALGRDGGLIVAQTVGALHFGDVGALVIARCVFKVAGKRHGRMPRMGGKGHDGAGVDAPREVKAHRHVAAQAQTHRGIQQAADFRRVHAGLCGAWQGPPAGKMLAHAAASQAYRQAVGGRQLEDALKPCAVRAGIAVG